MEPWRKILSGLTQAVVWVLMLATLSISELECKLSISTSTQVRFSGYPPALFVFKFYFTLTSADSASAISVL